MHARAHTHTHTHTHTHMLKQLPVLKYEGVIVYGFRFRALGNEGWGFVLAYTTCHLRTHLLKKLPVLVVLLHEHVERRVCRKHVRARRDLYIVSCASGGVAHTQGAFMPTHTARS
jgi:hypothetical protein